MSRGGWRPLPKDTIYICTNPHPNAETQRVTLFPGVLVEEVDKTPKRERWRYEKKKSKECLLFRFFLDRHQNEDKNVSACGLRLFSMLVTRAQAGKARQVKARQGAQFPLLYAESPRHHSIAQHSRRLERREVFHRHQHPSWRGHKREGQSTRESATWKPCVARPPFQAQTAGTVQ